MTNGKIFVKTKKKWSTKWISVVKWLEADNVNWTNKKKKLYLANDGFNAQYLLFVKHSLMFPVCNVY